MYETDTEKYFQKLTHTTKKQQSLMEWLCCFLKSLLKFFTAQSTHGSLLAVMTNHYAFFNLKVLDTDHKF